MDDKDFVKQLAEQGHCEARKILARILLENKNTSDALIWLEKAAESGDAWSQFKLGYIYLYGEGVDKDYDKAIMWLEKACKQGNGEALALLGKCYMIGSGCDKNYNKALELLNRAEINTTEDNLCRVMQYKALLFDRMGEIESYRNLIKLFAREGQGCVTCSYSTYDSNRRLCPCFLSYLTSYCKKYKDSDAIAQLLSLAESGVAEAQCELADMYYTGEGLEKNYKHAVKWYFLAAEQENPSAQYHLGLCHKEGNGVELDIDEAEKWFSKASKNGSILAYIELLKPKKENTESENDKIDYYDDWHNDDIEYYPSAYDSPYYNDALDMDQQSEDFWESL